MTNLNPDQIKRSALGKARNHGSAKQGTGHWIHQRLSAIALILLGPWFLYSVLTEDMTSYQGMMTWLESPGDVVFLVLTVVVALYHGALGLQVVIEDYVHSNGLKFPMLVIMRFTFVVLGVMAVYAIISSKFFVNPYDVSYYGPNSPTHSTHFQMSQATHSLSTTEVL